MTPTLRRMAAAAIAAAGLVHLLLVGQYLDEKTYLGVLFAVGGLWCAAVAARLARHDDPAAWAAGALVCLGMAVGFVLSRTVGLPGFHEEEWERSGVVSMVLEVVFAVAAGLALRAPRRAAGPPERAEQVPVG
jgi:drug/metabolite transporter (DMT)-like permease